MKAAASRPRSAKTSWRPSFGQVFGSPVHILAFGLGTGLSPVAPGTVGTLVGIPLWYLLAPLPFARYLGIVGGLALFGCWLCGASARRLGVHDHGGIVFDEVVGYLITGIPLLAGADIDPLRTLFGKELGDAIGIVCAFAAFRLFDIWKPWPIGWLDHHVRGGVGIMLDDVVAGLYGALLLTLGFGLAVESNL